MVLAEDHEGAGKKERIARAGEPRLARKRSPSQSEKVAVEKALGDLAVDQRIAVDHGHFENEEQAQQHCRDGCGEEPPAMPVD